DQAEVDVVARQLVGRAQRAGRELERREVALRRRSTLGDGEGLRRLGEGARAPAIREAVDLAPLATRRHRGVRGEDRFDQRRTGTRQSDDEERCLARVRGTQRVEEARVEGLDRALDLALVAGGIEARQERPLLAVAAREVLE